MHDQNSIDKNETSSQKYQRALDLFTESVMNPDPDLRGCAYNQDCFSELMEIREQVIKIVQELENPHTPPLKSGQKNNFKVPTVTTPNGEISETLMSGALGDYYADKREY